MRAGSVGRLRLTLPTALSFAGGLEAGVWKGQRCAYRNGACGVRTIARLRPLCPWSKAPDGLPGGGLRAFFRREAPGFGLWGGDVWWRRGPVPEGGWYGKGQGGGFLSSERPGAELKAEREGVEREERRLADTAGDMHKVSPISNSNLGVLYLA